MDATLFQHRIPVDRTNIFPETGDALTYDWALKVAQQTVRGAGFAGSVVCDLTLTKPSDSDWWHYDASAQVYLPTGAFGTVHPPLVFVMPQYGSVVVYKQFADERNALINVTGGFQGGFFGKYNEYFRTYIQNLTYEEVSEAGSTFFRWNFTAKHHCRMPPLLLNRKPPYIGFKYSWNPLGFVSRTAEPAESRKSIVLHWYALGSDLNSL